MVEPSTVGGLGTCIGGGGWSFLELGVFLKLIDNPEGMVELWSDAVVQPSTVGELGTGIGCCLGGGGCSSPPTTTLHSSFPSSASLSPSLLTACSCLESLRPGIELKPATVRELGTGIGGGFVS